MFPMGNAAGTVVAGDPVALRAPIARLTLERLADRLRDAAVFATAREGQDELLTIAEELSDLARTERRVAKELDDAGPVQPWALRIGLDLRSIKAARLLSLFVRAPATYHHREVLLRAVETTPSALVAMIWDIRRGLAPLGLRKELRHVDSGYLLSRRGAAAICGHCGPDRLNVLLESHDMSCLPRDLPPPMLPPTVVAADDQPVPTVEVASDRLTPTLRLFAAARGGRKTSEAGLHGGDLLDLVGRLSGMGLELVMILSANRGKFISHAALVERIGCADGSLKILILRVRRVFMRAGMADPIETKWGFGYRLAPEVLKSLASQADSLQVCPR